jgi:sigma-B regulation protein RsbU (phosphoserine phosphatase)
MTPTEHELDLKLAAQQCPAACQHHEAGTANRMCGEVGGDFYDFIPLNEDQSAIVLGDVVGHGVQAALVMAVIKGFLNSDTRDRMRPKNMMKALNAMLCGLGDRIGGITTCSMLYMVFDAPSGTCILCNAGHAAPLIVDRDKFCAVHLARHDILLGIEPYEPTEICLTFEEGQRLVMYTDGLTEATDVNGEFFGHNRLCSVLSETRNVSAQVCADAVMAAVDAFRGDAPQSDDETVVVLDRL